MTLNNKLVFNNGNEIPIFGLGTWKSLPGEVKDAVEYAIDAGYRHIDGAHVYGNEKEVGQGINNKIKEGVIKREDIFVTSKLWITSLRPDLVEDACKTTLKNLGLEYVDLYLIHWPFGLKEGDALFPIADGKTLNSDVDYMDTWKAMEKLAEKCLVKNIGVSNFNSSQLLRIMKNAKIKPVVNQVECHPYLTQTKLSKFCNDHGVLITSYGPLGSPYKSEANPSMPILIEDPVVKAIAAKYKKTTAQVLLRYQIDRGHIVIPKSVTKARIIQNFDVFGFKLTEDDVQTITALGRNHRFTPFTEARDHKAYPFNDEF